jgi:hypothetical protein
MEAERMGEQRCDLFEIVGDQAHEVGAKHAGGHPLGALLLTLLRKCRRRQAAVPLQLHGQCSHWWCCVMLTVSCHGCCMGWSTRQSPCSCRRLLIAFLARGVRCQLLAIFDERSCCALIIQVYAAILRCWPLETAPAQI